MPNFILIVWYCGIDNMTKYLVYFLLGHAVHWNNPSFHLRDSELSFSEFCRLVKYTEAENRHYYSHFLIDLHNLSRQVIDVDILCGKLIVHANLPGQAIEVDKITKVNIAAVLGFYSAVNLKCLAEKRDAYRTVTVGV